MGYLNIVQVADSADYARVQVRRALYSNVRFGSRVSYPSQQMELSNS